MTARTHAIARSSAETPLLVVSDSSVGSLLVTAVDAGQATLVTDSDRVAARAPDSVRTTVGDVTDVESLAPGADAAVAVVALRRDRQALLVTQLLRTRFGVDDVVVLLNDPGRRDAFAAADTTVVCGSNCLAAALGDAVEQTLSESYS